MFRATNPLELPTSAGKVDKCRPFTESAGRQAHPDAGKIKPYTTKDCSMKKTLLALTIPTLLAGCNP